MRGRKGGQGGAPGPARGRFASASVNGVEPFHGGGHGDERRENHAEDNHPMTPQRYGTPFSRPAEPGEVPGVEEGKPKGEGQGEGPYQNLQ